MILRMARAARYLTALVAAVLDIEWGYRQILAAHRERPEKPDNPASP